MIDTFIIAQLVGLLAAITNIIAVQWKHRRSILIWTIAAAVLWACHFLLLGATTGAILNALGIVMLVVFYHKNNPKERSLWLLFAMMAMLLVAGFVAWQGWTSLLAIVGTQAACLSFWQTNEQRIRQLLIVTSILWLVYNYLVISYVGFGKEVLTIISLFAALWRYRTTR